MVVFFLSAVVVVWEFLVSLVLPQHCSYRAMVLELAMVMVMGKALGMVAHLPQLLHYSLLVSSA